MIKTKEDCVKLLIEEIHREFNEEYAEKFSGLVDKYEGDLHALGLLLEDVNMTAFDKRMTALLKATLKERYEYSMAYQKLVFFAMGELTYISQKAKEIIRQKIQHKFDLTRREPDRRFKLVFNDSNLLFEIEEFKVGHEYAGFQRGIIKVYEFPSYTYYRAICEMGLLNLTEEEFLDKWLSLMHNQIKVNYDNYYREEEEWDSYLIESLL